MKRSHVMTAGEGQRRLDARDPGLLEVRSPFRYDPSHRFPDALFVTFQVVAWILVPLLTAVALGAAIAHALMPTIGLIVELPIVMPWDLPWSL